jgi:hypothetical protein
MDVPAQVDLMRSRRRTPAKAGNVGVIGRNTSTISPLQRPLGWTRCRLNEGCGADLRHIRSGLGLPEAQRLNKGHKQGTLFITDASQIGLLICLLGL